MQNKSIVELRGIAQSMGVKWSFGDDKERLIKAIQDKREAILPPPEPVYIPLPPDQKLRSKPPAKISDEKYIRQLLQPYIDRGLRFSVVDDGQNWIMEIGKKTDTGTMRQSPRILLQIAEKMLT